jgi:hypothetical protein
MHTYCKLKDGSIYIVWSIEDNEDVYLIPERQWIGNSYDPEFINCDKVKFDEIVFLSTLLSDVRDYVINN